jgi:hypothetical protein
VRRAGCPIRTPPDPRLPAPPRSIAPRGRVLPRPPTPRHPPCALPTEALVIPGGIPRPVPSGPRPGPTRASEDPVLPDHVPGPATFMTCSGFVMSRMTRSLPGPPDNCLPDFGDCRTSHYISNNICVQCARATGHDGPFLPRPRNRSGSTWRIVKVLAGCRRKRETNMPAVALPKEDFRGWSRGDSNPGPPPCKGGALPAKLRPPDRPDQPPPVPRGGRAWTRTRDLGLIRAAL